MSQSTVVVLVLAAGIIVDAVFTFVVANKDKHVQKVLREAREEREVLAERYEREREQLVLALISRETAVHEIISGKDDVTQQERLDMFVHETNFFPEMNPSSVDGDN